MRRVAGYLGFSLWLHLVQTSFRSTTQTPHHFLQSLHFRYLGLDFGCLCPQKSYISRTLPG